MNVPEALPIAFNYLDARTYLKDYYAYRKAHEKGFSYESWGYELEGTNRSFLRLIILGKKKITPKFIEVFSRLNFSSKDQEEYFHHMVKYSQAVNAKDKQAYSKLMLQILRRQTKQQELPSEDAFLSSPLIPRVLTLLGFGDLITTTKNLCQLLNADTASIENALQTLVTAGLVFTDKDDPTLWRTTKGYFKIPDKKGNLGLFHFHEQSLQDAIAAFHVEKALRRYKSLILPMTREGLEEFYKAMDEFSSEQFAKFSNDNYKDCYLFQINMNIHPVAYPATDKQIKED